MKFFLSVIFILLCGGLLTSAQDAPGTKISAEKTAAALTPVPWADFVETNFPFYSSVLDARKLGEGLPDDNLTPRGIILNLGNNCWACFDLDLLRIAAVWTGSGTSPVSMARISYHLDGAKAPDGQEKLPQIFGDPWLANGIYPGWQTGEKISIDDPREPAVDKTEIGRGAIPSAIGRFKAIHLTTHGVALEYEIAGVAVREEITAEIQGNRTIIRRHFRLGEMSKPLWLILGRKAQSISRTLEIGIATPGLTGNQSPMLSEENGLFAAQLFPSPKPSEFAVSFQLVGAPKKGSEPSAKKISYSSRVRWPQKVTTRATPSKANDAYVVDNISLPLKNPWKRNVRLADLAFLKDGRAAAVTFDGDVWIISGLGGDLNNIVWKRFSSGLHEPLSICVRNDEIFVFDRNGIWRLLDSDRNGEADVHELFSTASAQTAETREYANGMKLAPDGSFIIAKGGQQASTLGKQNGTVMRISPDGKNASTVGWGLRQPFIGVHPKTGMITASDQQGHYVPSTPLHIIRDNQFYGFLSQLLPKEKYPAPIAEPLTWIPHAINASGATQVWLADARMGPLNDSLIHIGYYRPEIFLVVTNNRTARPQAAVVSITRNLEFGPLNSAVNPVDGQLYVIGFKIWGTVANQVSGLARLRYTGAPSTLPREIVPMDKGILLRFDVALDPKKAANVENFSAERWNYQRTASYGSPHFKLDGSKGQDAMTPSSVYLSKDGKGVFIGIPDMKPVMQMRLGWSLATKEEAAFDQNSYFTPYELVHFDPVAEGFESLTVDLTPRKIEVAAASPITIAEGRRLSELVGCVACHSNDGTTLGKVGPTWKGLFKSEREFADGGKTIADENYLRQSIREPAVKIVKGFDKTDAGMPSYEGVITDAQIEALILYIKTVK